MAANWKLPIENYHECYHCPAIHPELCVVSPPTSGDNYTLPGLWVGGTMDLEPFAATMSMDGSSGGVGAPRARREAAPRDRLRRAVPEPADQRAPRLRDDAPHRAARARRARSSSASGCSRPRPSRPTGFDPAYAVDFWDVTNRQDWSACEGVQRGLGSRGYRPGPFAAQEDAVQQWVTLIARSYLAGALQPV